MDEYFKKAWAYLLGRADHLTAWIGFIGLVLQFLNLQSVMFILFIALLVLPEAQFNLFAREATKKLREADSKSKAQ